MSAVTVEDTNMKKPALDRYGKIGIIRSVIFFIIHIILLFGSAGSIQWRNGWIYIGIMIIFQLSIMILMIRINPELFSERARGIKKDTKRFDRVFFVLWMPLLFALPVVCAFDAVRYSWMVLPGWTIYPGIIISIPAYIISSWALLVNRHFEASVRIQTDRDHRVITDGPYQYIRHPGYIGGIVVTLATPLMLGSVWGFIPAALIAALFIARTALEDKTLRNELEGYADYSLKTRYRLFPFIW